MFQVDTAIFVLILCKKKPNTALLSFLKQSLTIVSSLISKTSKALSLTFLIKKSDLIKKFTTMDSVEIVGYFAMTFLVLSFIPKQIKPIRIINFIGCVLFVVYGVLLGWKWPLIVSNGLIAVIQVYHLIKMRFEKEKV